MTIKEAKRIIAVLKKYPLSSSTMHDYTLEDVLKYMEAQAITTAAETEKRVRGETIQECINAIIATDGTNVWKLTTIKKLKEALNPKKDD